MSGTKKPGKAAAEEAAASRSDAARDEVKGEERHPYTLECGVEVSLPAILPVSFSFDLGEIEARESMGMSAFGPAYKLLVSLIGMPKVNEIREAILKAANGSKADDDDDIDPQAGLVQILGEVIRARGTTVGESSASPTS